MSWAAWIQALAGHSTGFTKRPGCQIWNEAPNPSGDLELEGGGVGQRTGAPPPAFVDGSGRIMMRPMGPRHALEAHHPPMANRSAAKLI